MTVTTNDAFAQLQDVLNRYGLPSLTDWAWQQLVSGKSQDEISLSMYDQPAFKQRFPAIDARRAANLPAISPAEYVSFEDQARQVLSAAGFPPSFYDQPDDFTAWIAKDVSLNEVNQRAALYQQAAYQQPAEVRQQLHDLYGVSEGDLAAYFADPERALPILTQKFTASEIAGQAQRQQFGQLSQTEAERLASLGVTDQTAAQGFATVANAAELFAPLLGGQDAASRQDALGLVAGDAEAQRNVDQQAARRKAAFAGGGTYAASQQGVTGLGSART